MHKRKPADYTPPPLMDEVVAYYVKAFFRMSRSRPYHYGGSPGYLDLAAVTYYSQVFGEPTDIEEFTEIIFELDQVYLPIIVRRMQAAQKAKKNTSPGASRHPALPPGRGAGRG